MITLVSLILAFLIGFLVSRYLLGIAELERRVTERTQELATLAEAIPHIVWTANADGTVFYFNRRWTDYTGYELGQPTWEDVLHPEDVERCRNTWIDCIKKGLPYQVEYRLKSKAGEYRWFLVRGLPVVDPKGKTHKWFGTCTDTHDQKCTTESLKQALEALRRKSELLASVSHEIRTPLGGIIGMADLLDQTVLTGEQREYVDIVRASADTLLSLLNDLLDLSKIEAGKLELEEIEFSPAALLNEVRAMFFHSARAKGVELNLESSISDAITVCGDPTRLRQVFTNLISNAIKFTQRGSITIRAQLNDSAESGWKLLASVTDTGVGISHGSKSRLFQQFSQAGSSTAREYGGSGLGLSICKLIVEMMHGEIGFTSEVGKGSSFYFTASFEKPRTHQHWTGIQDLNPSMRALLLETHDTAAN